MFENVCLFWLNLECFLKDGGKVLLFKGKIKFYVLISERLGEAWLLLMT